MDVDIFVVDMIVAKNKETACLFASFQDGVMLRIIEDSSADMFKSSKEVISHVVQDPFTDLLQPSRKIVVPTAMDCSQQFQW